MKGTATSANARVIQEAVFVVKVKVSPEEELDGAAIRAEARCLTRGRGDWGTNNRIDSTRGAS